MNTTFKQFLTNKGITQEAFEGLDADKINALNTEFINLQIKELEASGVTKVELKEFKETLKGNPTKEEVATLKELIEATALELKGLTENGTTAKTVEEAVNNFITENAEEIKSIHKSRRGFVELEINKAVGTVTTGSASLPSPAPALQGTQVAPPSVVNLRGTIVNELVTTIPTTQASFAYSETLPKEGGYAFLAEAQIKPQMDFKIETRYASPVKMAAWIRLTEEAVTDIPQMQMIANDLLRKKHDLKKQNGILFGDGVAPNPKGATVVGRVFSAGGMALKVTTPNFMDVVNACITDIYTTHNYVDEMNYMANVVMVNPNDFFIEMVSAKDGNRLPLYPSASLFNRVTLGGVTIIPHEEIPSGKIFVADLSKYNTTDYVGYSVKIGWVDDDFIKNQFVILGESRFHAFVKKLDEQAFIYDDISTIKTAITAP